MSDFEPFTQKGGKIVTAKTASVTMNQHGYLNVPGSVREQVFDSAEYVEYHADHENNLLAIEPHAEDDAPPHSYTLSGDEDTSSSVGVKKVLEWMGKRPPEKHTMFELRQDSDAGLPYIDVGKLPDLNSND